MLYAPVTRFVVELVSANELLITDWKPFASVKADRAKFWEELAML